MRSVVGSDGGGERRRRVRPARVARAKRGQKDGGMVCLSSPKLLASGKKFVGYERDKSGLETFQSPLTEIKMILSS